MVIVSENVMVLSPMVTVVNALNSSFVPVKEPIALAEHDVAGTKSEHKAFTTVTIGDSTMIFSAIMAIHQALMLQNSTNCIFASKK